MRTYLLEGGRLYLVRELDRGRPIVWSREQWLARYRLMMRKGLRQTLLFSCTVILGLTGTLAVIEYLTTGEMDEPGLLAIILISLLTVQVIGAVIHIVRAKIPTQSPLQELTTMGVQLRRNLFIPYEEISEARVRRKTVLIVPRRPPETMPWNIPFPSSWSIDLGLLGEEGLRELLARVARDAPAIEPPKLVVYGPERS